jgi:hypothetical protein
MSRFYTVSSNAVVGAAAMDLALIIGAAGKVLKVHRLECASTDAAAPTSGELNFKAIYLPATVTNGSGGTTPTPAKQDQGDAAATFTAHANDTTPASTNSTAVTLWSGGAHVLTGLDYMPKSPWTVNPSTALEFFLVTLPSGTIHLDMCVTVEEIG